MSYLDVDELVLLAATHVGELLADFVTRSVFVFAFVVEVRDDVEHHLHLRY